MTLNKTIKGALILFSICSVALAVACNGNGGSGKRQGTEHVLPQEELFAGSGHADATAEPFNHWDEEGEIPTTCAKCHNTTGFLDFLGIADSTVRVVDHPVEIDPNADNALTCDTCHNEQTFRWDSVIFPSGAEVDNLGREALCMECHQGRESSVSVDAAIAEAAPPNDDTVSPDLGFINIHYFAAGATQYGTQAKGGYEYEGKVYDLKFAHVEQADTCFECHNPHSLEIEIDLCQQCHAGVQGEEDLKNIRMFGSLEDYNGNGNTREGIFYEVAGLQDKLNAAIQAYGDVVTGTCIVYDQNAYPYFFKDNNCNGVVDSGENVSSNRYDAWTARLVRATYNLQFTIKDPGAFAHNAKYDIELLFDSIEDLNSALPPASQIDMSQAHRTDAPHFDGTSEPFRHWDEDGEVSASCAKCHSSVGLPYFLETGTTQAAPITNGFMCSLCHPEIPDFDVRLTVPEVEFPSGAVIDSGDNSTNLCMECHQGRESKFSVDEAVAGIPDDTVSSSLSFINIHYFAAGATRYGTEAKGGYEYDGEIYDGFFPHTERFQNCSDCHSVHTQAVKVQLCGECHAGVVDEEDIQNIRMPGSTEDYNGNGDVTEGISFEISGLRDKLYNAIRVYGATTPGTKRIVYDENAYPYFFIDTNGNGQVDEGEATSSNAYDTWTPRLLKAAYNLQYSLKDPGCAAHNAKYIIELLYDSTVDLGTIDTSNLHRNDQGHFDPTAEPFRHWDEEGAVSATCSRCHTPEGFDYYITNFMIPPMGEPIPYGLTCDTCHAGVDYATDAPRKFVEKVIFPSGISYDNDAGNPDDSFICMSCHQGRESTNSVNEDVAGLPEDTVDSSLRFINVHYLPAGATIYGTGAKVAYEYTGKTYAGKFNHFQPSASQCPYCHLITRQRHTFLPTLKTPPDSDVACVSCHTEVVGNQIETIRKNRPIDYNGNGNITEPLEDETGTLADALYLTIRGYAHIRVGVDIAYDGSSYPYFFVDTNGNGIVDSGEDQGYNAWTPRLLKAAYNYQYYQKEPCTWAHNTDYIAQILIDSTADLGGNVSNFNRP